MAAAVHPVFWVGSGVCLLAFFVALFLPKRNEDLPELHTTEDCGETMIMAEQTTINARNQPASDE